MIKRDKEGRYESNYIAILNHIWINNYNFINSLVKESDGNSVEMNIFNPLWLDMESEIERCLVWYRVENQGIKKEFGV